MSTDTETGDDAVPAPREPSAYTDDVDRYINFAEDFLGVTLSATQKRILRAVVEHERVLIVSGNGVGKSFVIATLILAFAYTNPDSKVIGTSGSYQQFVDTMWRPMDDLWSDAKDRYGLPGRTLGGNNTPELRLGEDWYAKVISPRDPGDLEGRHADRVLVIIEEADKEYITRDHFDSAGSSVTDERDRMVAIANPPKDESDVVYDKMQSDRWHTIQFSSFESHNVKYDRGETDERLPGLVDLSTLKADWEAWNNEPWPGFEAARRSHERDDLDERWYRRRLGEIPPELASVHRPYGVSDVEAAFDRDPTQVTATPTGLGLDIARGGDETVLVGLFGREFRVLDAWRGDNHNDNEARVRRLLESNWRCPFAVDYVGTGDGLADRIDTFYPDRRRFNNGATPTTPERFDTLWAEANYHFGELLGDGAAFRDTTLREQALAAARALEFDEKYVAKYDGEVLSLTSKDAIKDRLGHSPDHLDACVMAAWAATAAGEARRSIPSTW